MRPTPASPIWRHAKAKLGWAYVLVRVIDLEAKTDEIQIVEPRADCSDLQLHGSTVIRPEVDLEEAERAEIVRRCDEAWTEEKQPLPWPTFS